MTTTTFKPVDELEPGETFSFPDDEDKNLYVLNDLDWNTNSVQPAVLIYGEVGAPLTHVNRTSHSPDELVKVWT